MKRGIEVIIHDTEELERKGDTLAQLASQLRWLCAKVYVDTAGSGAFVLAQLRADRIKAEPLPKDTGRDDGLRWLLQDPTDRYQTVADWTPEAQAQRAREGWPRYHRESSALLNEQLKAKEQVPVEPKWIAIEQRLKALEQKIEAAQCLAKDMHAEKSAALHNLRNSFNVFQRRVSAVELQQRNANASITALSQRVECRATVDRKPRPDREEAIAAYHSRPGSDVFVHNAGCQLEGQESRADECIECEPVKGEPTRDEDGTSLAQPPPFVTFTGEAPIDVTAKPAQPIVSGPGNEPDSCRRRYPLDPELSYEVCEDCGRDWRKHDVLPFESEDS